MAWQLKRLCKINLKEIFGDGQRALPIQTPNLSIGEDAKTDLAGGLDVNPAEILKHLGRRDTLVSLTSPIKCAIPTFGLQHGEPILKALPLIWLSNGTVPALSIRKKQRIWDLLPPLGG